MHDGAAGAADAGSLGLGDGGNTGGIDAVLAVDCTVGSFSGETLVDDLDSEPIALGLDDEGVYWVETGAWGQNDGSVKMALGSAAPVLVAGGIGNPLHASGHLAVDQTYVYWATIETMPSAMGFMGYTYVPGSQKLARATKTEAASTVTILEMSDVADMVYVGDELYVVSGTRLLRVPADGTSPEGVGPVGEPVSRVATDGEDLYVAVSSRTEWNGEISMGTAIQRFSLPDTRPVELYSTSEWGVFQATGPDAPKVASNGTHVAFTIDKSIRVVPVDGGAGVELAQTLGSVTSLTMDDDHVYYGTWAEEHSVFCVPVGGGEAMPVEGSRSEARGLAINKRHLYWVEAEPRWAAEPHRSHRLMRIAIE